MKSFLSNFKHFLRFSNLGEILFSLYLLITGSFKNVTVVKDVTAKTTRLKKKSLYRSMRIACAKQRFFKLFKYNNFFFLDLLLYFVKSFKYSIVNIFVTKKRINYRLEKTKQGFYFSFLNSSEKDNFYIKNIMLVGWKYL